MTPKAGAESGAFTITWTNDAGNHPPTYCTNPGEDAWLHTNKLILVRKAGESASIPDPSSGDKAFSLLGSATGYTDFVHRSYTYYTYRLFACEDGDCTMWYADGERGSSEQVSADSATEQTEEEVWKLLGVDDLEDTDRVVDDVGTSASTALFYPEDFSHEGKLAIWWSVSTPSEPELIKWKAANDTGWRSWNLYTNWTDEVVVAEAVTDLEGMYGKVSLGGRRGRWESLHQAVRTDGRRWRRSFPGHQHGLDR